MSAENRSREPAKRVFAGEIREADEIYKESDDEYAPSYLLLPSGGKANRLLIGGTLTEVEDIGSGDDEYWRARITDTTGTFLVFAGQYQPEAAAKLRELNDDPEGVPSFVTVVGKPNEFDPDDGDTIITIRPESISVVDGDTRNKWLAETAQDTLDRLEPMEGELVERAANHYGSVKEDLTQTTIEALETLQDETDE